MPRIFDNIQHNLLPALRQNLTTAYRADFCVGYFNLRGWKGLADLVDRWPGGEGQCARVLIGMHRSPQDELRETLSLARRENGMDNQTAARLRRQLAQEFRDQLTHGAPTDADEAGLRKLAVQLRARQVVVKLFLRQPLHAKLYLLYRDDYNNPVTAYLGSSNLTFPGLYDQGELNIDVLDHDAAQKLADWFEARWQDRFCLDISDELADIIEESWTRTDLTPYQIYVKIAYHLSQEARTGQASFKIPRDFGGQLLDFQARAVQVAAQHLHRRGGVVIGDVVGLGKTLMATALARVFEDDFDLETLIICPKNLERMWQDYHDRYRLRGRVLPITRFEREAQELRRFRLVLIDESHNLRNREGKRYKAIHEYIQRNDSKVILLSATPYNKTYLDLSSQLRLFIDETEDLGLRPERLLAEIGEIEFSRRHQANPRTLAAFEKSEYADDWRELMRLFMVRRTRSFIKANYAATDAATGRPYLTFADGRRSYFPSRVPKALGFAIDDSDPHDQYARLYDSDVVDTITTLHLPRYGLGGYVSQAASRAATAAERELIDNLGRAGQRLIGFSRTNLFKRLESSGQAFLQSVERHVLRNMVFLHALDTGQPLPIGALDVAALSVDDAISQLDTRLDDDDIEQGTDLPGLDDEDAAPPLAVGGLLTADDFARRAAQVYAQYRGPLRARFKWLRAALFSPALADDLRADTAALLGILAASGDWDPARDTKLDALVDLLRRTHPREKVLVFSQFADTVDYLAEQLQARGVARVAGVTGHAGDPTELVRRFSPVSNERRGRLRPEDELRVLVATDVLSEGQNLQDAALVVNYDLPWAIIRLIQRAGRVDRIGQQADEIRVYTFLPADGVERIINLRGRVRQRLRENAEVVGTDEAFFEDDRNDQAVRDLYSERAGSLDEEEDGETDLASQAYAIWEKAIAHDPSLKRLIPGLPDVVSSAKAHQPSLAGPPGALVYVRTAQDSDALAWIDEQGTSVTESQYEILLAAACAPDEPAVPRPPGQHALVEQGVAHILEETRSLGGQLGRPSGARFKVYERLKRYQASVAGSLFDTPELRRAIDELYRYVLRPGAVDTLNRQLRAGISDAQLAELVIDLRDREALSVVMDDNGGVTEPRIICSLGLVSPPAGSPARG